MQQMIAAIDVGSHAIRMKIGEMNQKGEFRELERFRKVAALGHDTFTHGQVSFETVDKVCNILKSYGNAMNDYGIKTYKALATSAIREASNKAYIIDQIKLKTGLDVVVIDNSEEQFLTHKAVKYKLAQFDSMKQEGAMIVVIGAGSIQITLYREGDLISSQNVKMGALRIREVLGSIEDETLKYDKIVEEYISANFEGLDFFKQPVLCKHFIAVGGEIGEIKRLISKLDPVDEQEEYITKGQFNNLFDSLIDKSTEEIEADLGIKRERAAVIKPSMMLFKKFFEHADTDNIVVPDIALTDGIIWDLYENNMKVGKKDKFTEDIVTSAKVIAEKFNYHQAHSDSVERNALLLFDKLKKIHGLENERILLRIAAILHDIGKFIGLDQHAQHSYDIIRSLEIFGLSKEQMELIACISKYHSRLVPNSQDLSFMHLSEKNQVLVAKLVAILRMADALDRSHQQKIEIQVVKVKDKELLIRAVASVNTKLEEWTFSNKAVFFQEVFGITPVLKIKKNLE